MYFPRALVLYPDYFLSVKSEMRFLDRYLEALQANTPYQIIDPKRSTRFALSLQTINDPAAIAEIYANFLDEASALFFMPLPPSALTGHFIAPISVTTAAVIDRAWANSNTSLDKPVFEIIPQRIWHQPLMQKLTPEMLDMRRIDLSNTEFLEQCLRSGKMRRGA